MSRELKSDSFENSGWSLMYTDSEIQRVSGIARSSFERFESARYKSKNSFRKKVSAVRFFLVLISVWLLVFASERTFDTNGQAIAAGPNFAPVQKQDKGTKETVDGAKNALPDAVDPSQKDWYKKYRKQQNIPDPAMQLLNTDKEPDVSGPGFKPLFNGKDLTGWTPRGGTCRFEAQDGGIIGITVPDSQSTYLCTDRTDFKNFIFTCDMYWDVDGNSGVMFRAQVRKDKKKDREIVFGPQAEMEGFERDRGWSGGVYGQSCGGYFYPLWLKQHAKVRQALKKDDWNRITILANDAVVKTWVNGIPAAHWLDDGTYREGFFGLQIHKGKQGQVRFRNLLVRELK